MFTLEILIAEDQDADAFFIEQAFKKSDIPARLHFVRDGQEAVDFVLGRGKFEDMPQPHMIIMDINMPRKNGHEALWEIKSLPEYKDVPIIMLSGSTSEDDIRQSLENHASAYFPKATGMEGMSALVNNIEKFWMSYSAEAVAQ